MSHQRYPSHDAVKEPHAISLKVLRIRDVRIDAEMKTPAGIRAQKLELSGAATGPLDLAEGETLQGVVTFDLKEEGNHVLAVTVSYYEASDTSGRTRTFRKLYQFICKPSLIVRTKVSALPGVKAAGGEEEEEEEERSRWVLEAQLENCSDEVMQLEKVAMECEAELAYRDCNWKVSGSTKPVLHPGETEQLCFVVNEKEDGTRVKATRDGRIIFGVLGIGWRGEMGNRGFLSTGKLAAKAQVEV
uniref:Trafficking protein particle complex subunit 13 n=1 Tax=Bionectria ochroleuca TaxID=29856 RepID=A0A0B7JR39_BIOOC